MHMVLAFGLAVPNLGLGVSVKHAGALSFKMGGDNCCAELSEASFAQSATCE